MPIKELALIFVHLRTLVFNKGQHSPTICGRVVILEQD